MICIPIFSVELLGKTFYTYVLTSYNRDFWVSFFGLWKTFVSFLTFRSAAFLLILCVHDIFNTIRYTQNSKDSFFFMLCFSNVETSFPYKDSVRFNNVLCLVVILNRGFDSTDIIFINDDRPFYFCLINFFHFLLFPRVSSLLSVYISSYLHHFLLPYMWSFLDFS